MASIYYEPTRDKHVLKTSIPLASLTVLNISKTDSYLTDPVTGKNVLNALADNATKIEDSNGDASLVRDSSERIIQRAKEYQSAINDVKLGGDLSNYDAQSGEYSGAADGSFIGDNEILGANKADQNNIEGSVNLGESWTNSKVKKLDAYQETVGGADMSVFFITEIPNIRDIVDGVEKDLIRKELVVLEMDNVLSLQYSIMREVFPVRRMGLANPIDYTRGPRTIAGHVAFAVFAEDVLARLRSNMLDKFNDIFDNLKNNTNEDIATMYEYYNAALHFNSVQLLDTLPPFHLLVMGVNENGVLSKFVLKNIHIIDENQLQGTRQPNIMNKASFVALDIVPMNAADQSRIISSSMEDSLSNTNIVNKNYSASEALNKSIRKDLGV